MFLRTFFVLAATALVGVSAVASPAVTIKAPAVVGTKETEFGTLTFYGRPADYAPSLQARQGCDTPIIRCLANSSIVPNTQACRLLITALDVLPAFEIEPETHGVCTGLDNHTQCCLSWEDAGVGLQSKDLVGAANSIFTRCLPDEAGSATEVNLRGVCTRECLLAVVGTCQRAPVPPPPPPPPPPPAQTQ